jgi:hypothetical protein
MKRKKRTVAEPVQVYLEAADRDRLERLARQFDTTKSDILRRGLAAVERELLDPESHPVLRIIGIARAHRTPDPYDVAREHDRAFADDEEARWRQPPRRRGR